ncbi:MAG: hypothetical protein ACOVP4_09260 [Bacteriovoracaceae bacterium]
MKVKMQMARTLSVILSYQMMVAPVVYAQTSGSTSTPATDTKEPSWWSKAGSTASDILQIGAGAFNSFQGSQMQNMATPDIVALQQNLNPIQDKYFSIDRMQKIPGLMEYMQVMGKNPQSLNCTSMNTTLNDVKSEVCRLGVVQDTGVDPNYQLQLLNTYANVYSDIEKQYDNFSQQSNQGGQAYGLGCMEDAHKILQGFFDYRKKEMDNLVANIEALNQKFKDAAKADLDNIEESTVLLDGGSGALANKVKTAKPQLFDFSSQFNDPACRSMFAGETMADQGSKKGLNSIQDLIVKATEAKPAAAAGAAAGKAFSGETYLKAHTSLVEDIKKMVDGVAKQSELKFGELAGNGKSLFDMSSGIGSVYGAESALKNPAIFSDIQQNFSEENQKLQTQFAEVEAELRSAKGDTRTVSTLMTNLNAGTFDQELTKIQNGIENDCIKNSSQLDTVISKMIDPEVSGFGNRNAPSFIKDKLKQILANDLSSADRKMQELIALEKQGASRYYVKLDASYEVQEEVNGQIVRTVVTPTTRKTPTAFLADVIKSCKAQFKSNTLETKYSGASAIAKMKELRNSYKALASTTSAKIKSELTKKLIDCDSNVVANQDNVGSCTSESFNMARPGFCANAALSCSKNMISCKAKAQKMVTDIKTNRQNAVKRYTANVEKNKKDLIAIFDTALTAFKAQGTQLGSAFDIPWQSPTGIERELADTDPSKYHSELAKMGNDRDGKILLENPDAYVALLKKNVEKLKASIDTQAKAIVGSGSLLGKHIDETKKNYTAAKSQAAKKEQECRNQYDGYVKGANQSLAEQQKKQAEDAAKAAELCSIVDGVGENPIELCNDSLDLSQDVLKAASQLGNKDASKAAKAYQGACKSYMNSQEAETNVTPIAIQNACKKLSGVADYSEICSGDYKKIGKVDGKSCDSLKTDSGFSMCDNNGTKLATSCTDANSKLTPIGIDKLRSIAPQNDVVKKYDKFCVTDQYAVVIQAAQAQDLKTFGEKLGGYCSAQSGQQGNFKNMFEGLGGLGQQPNTSGARQQ